MQPLHRRITRVLVILLTLSLAACGAATTGQTTGGTPAVTAQPTVVKAGPTAPPTVTKQFCESVMSVAQANQIMQPPTAITTITVQSDPELSVCSYIAPQTQFAVVKILIDGKPYSGPHPVPESDIIDLISQLENDQHANVTTAMAVTGVGDQAEFIAANVSDQNVTFYVDAFYVIYGNVVYMCDDFHMGAKPDDAAQLNALQQCAALVIPHL